MMTLASTLCTSCGLCCSGVLFTRATLRPDELAWAKKRRILPLLSEKEPSMPLPCSLLEDRTCTSYEDRPAICAAFKCKLLMRLEEGEISLDEALGKVRRLEALHARAANAVPGSVEGMLDLGELEMVATRDFRERPPPST